MASPRMVIAAALAGIALAFALADVAAESLLPIDPATAGMTFAVAAIGSSTAAFFISLGRSSVTVSVLLVATGLVIMLHGLEGTRNLAVIYFPGPILGFLFGLWVIALGISKSISTRRSYSAKSTR